MWALPLPTWSSEWIALLPSPRRGPETVFERDVGTCAEFGKGDSAAFHLRVAKANSRLATSAKRKLETWSAKVARENPSPHFWVALCDAAPASMLAKLLKSGADLEQFVDPIPEGA